MTPELRSTDPNPPGWRLRLGVVVARNWIAIAALLALAAASVAIYGLVVRQGDLEETLGRIQASRVETARTVCSFNDEQNRPILAILDFSYEVNREREPGPQTEQRIREAKALARPLTPDETRRACEALVTRVKSGPPPPP